MTRVRFRRAIWLGFLMMVLTALPAIGAVCQSEHTFLFAHTQDAEPLDQNTAGELSQPHQAGSGNAFDLHCATSAVLPAGISINTDEKQTLVDHWAFPAPPATNPGIDPPPPR